MAQSVKYLVFIGLCAFSLAACAPAYSPNTYSSNAVQLANKVDAGTVVGFREVHISADGSVGAVTGGAAGGVLGGEYGNSALAAIGGTTVGAMVGTAIEHATGDTTGWEYIIRKLNGDMLSVTQRERKPLELGQKVLVINGPQARVVPDYSMASEQPAPAPPATKEKAESKPESNVKVEVVLSLPPGVSVQSLDGKTIAVQSAPADETAPASATITPTSIPVSMHISTSAPASKSAVVAATEPLPAPEPPSALLAVQHVESDMAAGNDNKAVVQTSAAAP